MNYNCIIPPLNRCTYFLALVQPGSRKELNTQQYSIFHDLFSVIYLDYTWLFWSLEPKLLFQNEIHTSSASSFSLPICSFQKPTCASAPNQILFHFPWAIQAPFSPLLLHLILFIVWFLVIFSLFFHFQNDYCDINIPQRISMMIKLHDLCWEACQILNVLSKLILLLLLQQSE